MNKYIEPFWNPITQKMNYITGLRDGQGNEIPINIEPTLEAAEPSHRGNE